MTTANFRSPLLALMASATLLLAAGAAPSFAGNGNVLYLLQDSTGAIANGNSFGSDQTLSSNSSIGSAQQPATQRGQGNVANIRIISDCPALAGDCGHAELWQNNLASDLAGANGYDLPLPAGLTAGNAATLQVSNEGSAAVSQLGFGNVANLTTNGANGAINQTGLDNQGTLRLTTALLPSGGGGLANGTLTQLGNSNSANLDVTAAAGTSVTYAQIGTGLTQGPVVVQTNQSVTITQYSNPAPSFP